ncbi:beta-ketoacyl synthase N-terminal-like domain-containing protein [Streptomyces sp. NPDC056468]|uniref:beta-ketoacyl synthase N-terminal-like domain-containing protein n=1 Tax=Streptomyces sp. NPDC056468 TaxID=3345830 RepID=UPI0036A4223E
MAYPLASSRPSSTPRDAPSILTTAGTPRPPRRHPAALDVVDSFDAGFFRIYPREAELLDPHHLALETVWSALEDSAYRPADLPVNTGVLLGVSGNEPRRAGPSRAARGSSGSRRAAQASGSPRSRTERRCPGHQPGADANGLVSASKRRVRCRQSSTATRTCGPNRPIHDRARPCPAEVAGTVTALNADSLCAAGPRPGGDPTERRSPSH